jgi:hypothetical protein
MNACRPLDPGLVTRQLPEDRLGRADAPLQPGVGVAGDVDATTPSAIGSALLQHTIDLVACVTLCLSLGWREWEHAVM